MFKNKEKIQLNTLSIWILFSFVIAAAGALFAWVQISGYEKGVMEIYATQQDAYVQFVLDQVNLNQEAQDESVIIDIIGTLDSSGNKFWTLSAEETLLFVKDVLETSRYKGFTTKTYYISECAEHFIDNLSLNKVTHSLVELNDKEYIASGAEFLYQGETYQICLLTNPEVVLDHNAYLGAKINLCLAIAVILCVFVITVIALARKSSKKSRQLKEEQEKNTNLTKMAEQLNRELSMNNLYDVGQAVFQAEFLPMFLEKLKKDEYLPVTVMLLEYDNEKTLSFFLEDCYLMLNKKIFRFRDDKNKKIFLVAVKYDGKEAVKAVDWLLYREIRLVGTECIDGKNGLTLEQVVNKLCRAEEE